METWILRVWLPDRPGALGAVASRIGAVGADVVAIEVLERGGGRAVDELIIRLPETALSDLLLAEIAQVDGVDVEDLRPAPAGLLDGRLAALETAAVLSAVDVAEDLLDVLCVHLRTVLEADWVVVLDQADGAAVVSAGAPPPAPWVEAFVHGSQDAARAAGRGGVDDTVWAPLPSTGLTIVLGRPGSPFRARERREIAALARVAAARLADLARWTSRLRHPSCR